MFPSHDHVGPDVKNVFNKLSEDKTNLSVEKIDLSLRGYTSKVSVTDFIRRQRQNAEDINLIIKKGQDKIADLNNFETDLKIARNATDDAFREIDKMKATMIENGISTSALDARQSEISKDKQDINQMLKVLDSQRKRIKSL